MKLNRQAFLIMFCLAGLSWASQAVSIQIQHKWLLQQQYEPAPPGMVFVPVGEFWMGSDDPLAETDERPRHQVFTHAYYIDIHEVTNREYKRFKKDHQFPIGEEDYPVTFVLKKDAEAYCRYVGKRLPTNAEWEKAARGTDGRLFPWGNDFKPEYANLDPRGATNLVQCVLPGRSPNARGKLPPGSFPKGASPYGCMDMAGNVWEWVSDEYRHRSIFLNERDAYGIIRGGAYGYSPRQGRSSYQGFEALNTTCHDVGLRCAMDATPKKR